MAVRVKGTVMDFSFSRVESANLDLISLRRVFDAACDDLEIGVHSLDIALRERLVQCILRLARQGESNAGALQKRAVLYVRNTEAFCVRPSNNIVAHTG
jgi:hypothetical protein